MRVTWHPQAEDELIDAARFDNRRVPGLGADYLDAVDSATETFPVVEDDIRRCRVKRFPHSVYYRVLPDRIRILTVRHHSRDSGYWSGRK